jgi:ubiquinone biosynthesis protein COQ4
VTASEKQTWGFRLEPRTWLRLARLVRAEPGDVALGAHVFFAVGGNDEGPSHQRFQQTTTGARLVRERIPYPALYTDYDGLRRLPDGTLGREYVRELDTRGIQPPELDRLTHQAYEGRAFTPDHAYVRDRVRQAHDLLHTLTGYGIDLTGEGGVLSFTFGQTGNKGFLGLVVLNVLGALARLRFDVLLVSWKGYRRGRRARFVPGLEDWDRLLRLPLGEVRAELEIPPLEPYRTLQLEDVYRFAAPRD